MFEPEFKRKKLLVTQKTNKNWIGLKTKFQSIRFLHYRVVFLLCLVVEFAQVQSTNKKVLKIFDYILSMKE